MLIYIGTQRALVVKAAGLAVKCEQIDKLLECQLEGFN